MLQLRGSQACVQVYGGMGGEESFAPLDWDSRLTRLTEEDMATRVLYDNLYTQETYSWMMRVQICGIIGEATSCRGGLFNLGPSLSL